MAHYWRLDLETDDCTGPFSRYTGEDMVNQLYDNVFYARRIIGATYLFFSPTDFRWICSNTIQDLLNGGQCRGDFNSETIINYQIDPQWTKFKVIKSVNDYSWSFTKNATILIECISSSPTREPTPAPTLNYTFTETELEAFRAAIKEEFDDSGQSKPFGKFYSFII